MNARICLRLLRECVVASFCRLGREGWQKKVGLMASSWPYFFPLEVIFEKKTWAVEDFQPVLFSLWVHFFF